MEEIRKEFGKKFLDGDKLEDNLEIYDLDVSELWQWIETKLTEAKQVQVKAEVMPQIAECIWTTDYDKHGRLEGYNTTCGEWKAYYFMDNYCPNCGCKIKKNDSNFEA